MRDASKWVDHDTAARSLRRELLVATRTIGATDDFGFAAVENKVHVHDFHATILHLLGIDHKLLTYFHSGRDYRLTDVEGRVVEEVVR